MKEVTLKELRQWKRERRTFTIIDTRAADYFHWEHIQGAINLRWKDVALLAKKKFPDKKAILVTSCQSVLCDASVRAARALIKLGYKNVFEFSGGISEWKAAGLPVAITRGSRAGNIAYRLVTSGKQRNHSFLVETAALLVLIDPPEIIDDGREDYITSFDKPIVILLTSTGQRPSVTLLQKKYRAQVIIVSSCRLQGAKKIKFLLSKLKKRNEV